MNGTLASLIVYTVLAAYATGVIFVRSYVYTLLMPLVCNN